MISIIIPVWNQADKIGECLDSILAQEFKDYEIIIINDGSEDNVLEVLEPYRGKFEKIEILNQENKGSNPTRNRGGRHASGEYLLFCDADIEFFGEALAKMNAVLDNNHDVSFVYPSHIFGNKLFELWEYDLDKLRQMPYIHTTALLRKEHYPGFDESIKKFQDWDLWLTMAGNGYKGKWIPEVLFKIKSGGTMSGWMPSFVYKVFPFLPKVKKYKEGMKVIKQKHNIQ